MYILLKRSSFTSQERMSSRTSIVEHSVRLNLAIVGYNIDIKPRHIREISTGELQLAGIISI